MNAMYLEPPDNDDRKRKDEPVVEEPEDDFESNYYADEEESSEYERNTSQAPNDYRSVKNQAENRNWASSPRQHPRIWVHPFVSQVLSEILPRKVTLSLGDILSGLAIFVGATFVLMKGSDPNTRGAFRQHVRDLTSSAAEFNPSHLLRNTATPIIEEVIEKQKQENEAITKSIQSIAGFINDENKMKSVLKDSVQEVVDKALTNGFGKKDSLIEAGITFQAGVGPGDGPGSVSAQSSSSQAPWAKGLDNSGSSSRSFDAGRMVGENVKPTWFFGFYVKMDLFKWLSK